MSTRFHINDRGEAGQCGATKGLCPFGGENVHFSTADDARKAYEAAQGNAFQNPPVPPSPTVTYGEYRRIFSQYSLYNWPTSAINLPAGTVAPREGTLDTVNEELGLSEVATRKQFATMTASLKKAVRDMTKVENVQYRDTAVQDKLALIVKASASRSANKAYAAMAVMQLAQNDLKKFNVPRLAPPQQAVIDYWNEHKPLNPSIRGERGGTGYYEGSDYRHLSAQSDEDLESTLALLDRDLTTWTNEEENLVHRVVSPELARLPGFFQRLERSGKRPAGLFKSFSKEKHIPEVLTYTRDIVSKARSAKAHEAREVELLRAAFGK